MPITTIVQATGYQLLTVASSVARAIRVESARVRPARVCPPEMGQDLLQVWLAALSERATRPVRPR